VWRDKAGAARFTTTGQKVGGHRKTGPGRIQSAFNAKAQHCQAAAKNNSKKTP
jgi:hypothetical protein